MEKSPIKTGKSPAKPVGKAASSINKEKIKSNLVLMDSEYNTECGCPNHATAEEQSDALLAESATKQVKNNFILQSIIIGEAFAIPRCKAPFKFRK